MSSLLNKYLPAHSLSTSWLPFFSSYLVIALLGITVWAMTYSYYGLFNRGYDSQLYYLQLRSIIINGDLNLANDFEATPRPDILHKNQLIQYRSDGEPLVFFSFGWAAITALPYVIIHLFVKIFNGNADGFSAAYDIGSAFWHLLLCLAGVLLTGLAAIRLSAGNKIAAAIAILAGFCTTNVWYYASIYPNHNHAASFACISLIIYCAIWAERTHHSIAPWIVAGLSTYFVTLIRPTDLVLLSVLLPALYTRYKHNQGINRILPFAPLAVGFFCAILTQLLIWRLNHGYWVINAYAQHGYTFNFLSPALIDITIGNKQGIGAWVFHPFYFFGCIAMAGLVWFDPKRRIFWLAALIGVFLHIYIHSSYKTWTFGHTFGHRVFVNSSPFMIIAISALYSKVKRDISKPVLATVISLIIWNSIMIINYEKGGINKSWPISMSTLLESQKQSIIEIKNFLLTSENK